MLTGATVATNTTTVPTASAAAAGPAFWIANPQGNVWGFGGAAKYGDLTGVPLNRPIVGMTPTNDLKGYWLVATDGGIFAYGNAKFYGSTGNIKLNQPIVGMASTPSGNGYWMVASDGGIFAYGDAKFFGSTGSIKLNKPIVAMASTPTGNGYWLTASDGGIFAYGDAKFFGSTGSIKLNRAIVSMTPTPDSQGYWLVASDGGIFAYGTAKFYGSPGGGADQSYSRLLTTPDAKGYWLVRNGGDSTAYGSAAGVSAASNPIPDADDPTSNIPDPEFDAAGLPQRPPVALLYNITGPGDVAVLYAMGQMGKPYVWGGSGPDGFDCSGLTLKAWQAASVGIPRIANDQYAYSGGKLVPVAGGLRPGDLVFWGSNVNDPRSIYHVALYVGGNTVLMAPKTGDVVRFATIWPTDLMPMAMRPAS
jgi:cell wall-associated NlpC family hydrolase